MDPKQKSTLGDNPGGGQEGQNPSSASVGANSGVTPVFSSGTNATSAGASASDQKMPGTLGAENLSTGANVSRTMESLNSKNQSETGTSVFSKHKFDRAEPDGSILIPESKGLFFRKSRGDKDNDVTGSMIAARGESVDGLDPETRRKRRILRIGGIVGGALAVILAVVIVVVLVAAPRREKPKASTVAPTTELNIAFNKYANFILYGEASAESISEDVSIAKIYEINKMVSAGTEESKQYFNDAKSNFDAFMTSYIASGIAEKSYYLNWFVPHYEQVFDFVYNYSQAGKLDNNTLLPIFLASGTSGMDTYFDQNYKVFQDSELDNSKEFYESQKQILEYRKQYFNLARQNNCIRTANIVDGCKVSMSAEEMTKYNDAIRLSGSRVELSVDELVSNIPRIQTEISQPIKEKQETEDVVNENGIRPSDIIIKTDKKDDNNA